MSDCEICGGDGVYPIISARGSHVYDITCPECHGSGDAEEEPKAEPLDYPPASTAVRIKTMDDLKEHIRTHWSASAIPQAEGKT